MATLNTYECPKCNRKIPFFYPWATPVWRGFFKSADILCPYCGFQSRQKINYRIALWSWPLTVLLTLSVLFFVNSEILTKTNYTLISTVIYGTIYGLLIGVIMSVGFRSGLRLVASPEQVSGTISKKKLNTKFYLGSIVWFIVVMSIIIAILFVGSTCP